MSDQKIIEYPNKKRSICIAGHQTSLSIEDPFWDIIKKIAEEQNLSLNQFITQIDDQTTGNLSSALRIMALKYTQK
jgi:predicted DNA-binding ribbon-helix-helix protein